MKYATYAQKTKTLLQFIQKKQGDSPVVLAKKIGVSERTLLRMIALLKEDGYPVYYCRRTKKYLLK
jgi:predicted DNA-binding transcriptional regulator YafY